MKCGTFRLKGRELLERYGNEKSRYRVAEDSKLSYGTIHRWTDEEVIVVNVQSDQLFTFLVDGLDLPVDEVEKMTLGEVFELVSSNGDAAQ